MEKITAAHPLSKSADIIQQNLDTLKSLFPTIVKEGKIDVTELQALLGEEIETNDEYYRFTWAGKSQARQEANKPSTGTLRPVKEESKDWDTTGNIFIEGDNLEVLKLMQKSYANKIKMIYIDPPYNTGKDFVYKDNYNDNLGNYLSITGQTDEAGKKLSTNTESEGRYHSNWLNMMYPRLKLARNLLKEDGVIFISIDDNEVANLRKVCDEIFGEENFLCEFIWRRRASSALSDNNVSTDHEYVISYHKGTLDLFLGVEKDFKSYSNPDSDPRGPWVLGDLTVGMTASMRPNQAYNLVNPMNGSVYSFNPNRVWAYIPSSMNELIKEGRVYFPEDISKRPMLKRFQKELKSTFNPLSSILIEKVGLNTEATKIMQQLLGGNIFDYSKPLSLLNTLVSQVATAHDIILDFFSGSGTTAHATMQLNSEDGGNRKFICVQLPEPTPPESEAFKAGYATIAEITKERIRRAGEKIKKEKEGDGAQLTIDHSPFTTDIGFRVFKLDSSNINAWDGDVQHFQQNLLSASENIKEDRTEEDVLYEVLLKSGLDLAQPIEEKNVAGKRVFNIGVGALFICLADNITKAVAEGIGQWKQELEPATCRVIFKDTGFTDVEKTNSVQILKRYGITEVNTI